MDADGRIRALPCSRRTRSGRIPMARARDVPAAVLLPVLAPSTAGCSAVVEAARLRIRTAGAALPGRVNAQLRIDS